MPTVPLVDSAIQDSDEMKITLSLLCPESGYLPTTVNLAMKSDREVCSSSTSLSGVPRVDQELKLTAMQNTTGSCVRTYVCKWNEWLLSMPVQALPY